MAECCILKEKGVGVLTRSSVPRPDGDRIAHPRQEAREHPRDQALRHLQRGPRPSPEVNDRLVRRAPQESRAVTVPDSQAIAVADRRG
jgi:hypothetical protein